MMAERVPIDTYCEKKIPTLQKTYDGLIDYVDISSVDNTEKKIISYQTIESNGAPSRAKQLLKKGDVLVSTVRPNLNAVAVVEEETENLMVGSTGYCVLRCKDNMDVRYLFNFCQSQYFVDDMSSQATGASYPAVSNGIVRSALIPCYSIEEQRGIAEKMDTVSELLALRKQQLEQLEELVKARFIELFGDPSSNPMGWKETTVGEECHYIKDGPHKSLPDVGEGNGYPFISVRNIVNGYIDFSTAKYISKQDYLDSIKKCHPQKGDMLYSKGGTTGIAKLVDVDVEFANWVHVAVLKFDASLNGIFFENMLNSDYCYDQSQKLTKGIANRDLVLSAMAQIKMYKPPLELQEQFAAFVEQTEKSKLAVQQSIAELEELKKSLMQKYFG